MSFLYYSDYRTQHFTNKSVFCFVRFWQGINSRLLKATPSRRANLNAAFSSFCSNTCSKVCPSHAFMQRLLSPNCSPPFSHLRVFYAFVVGRWADDSNLLSEGSSFKPFIYLFTSYQLWFACNAYSDVRRPECCKSGHFQLTWFQIWWQVEADLCWHCVMLIFCVIPAVTSNS